MKPSVWWLRDVVTTTAGDPLSSIGRICTGRQEALQQCRVFTPTRGESGPIIAQPPIGSPEHPAALAVAAFHDLGDLGVGQVERGSKDENRPRK